MLTEFLIGLHCFLIIIALLLLIKKENNAFTYRNELLSIFSLLNKIQMNQEELAAELAALKEQTERSTAEIITKIAALEDAITNAGNITPEVEAALTALKAAVQGVDDVA